VSSVRNRKLKVFISYSRNDEDFAHDLLAGLQVAGFEPYLDKHDIAAAARLSASSKLPMKTLPIA
jgi:TIR domain